jgi:hypothetical protein
MLRGKSFDLVHVAFADEFVSSLAVTRSLQDSLSDLLISQDSLIRTSVLEILSHAKQPIIPKARGSEGASHDEANLYELCLHVEEAGMSLQNVREKTTKIRKVEIALRDLDLRGEEEASLLKNLICYLISMSLDLSLRDAVTYTSWNL